jgi:replicative DNA helicase
MLNQQNQERLFLMVLELRGCNMDDFLNTEISVLSIIANNHEQYFIAKDMLSEKDFHSSSTREIWAAMEALTEDRIKTSTFQLKRKVKSEAAKVLLTSFSGNAIAREVGPYCSLLIRENRENEFNAVLVAASSSTGDAEEKVNAIEQAIERYRTTGEAISLSFSELLSQTVDFLERTFDGDVGIKTGLPCLDKQIGGLQKGRLIVVAARPACGKTALTLQMALNAAKNGHPVGICSLEMSAHELGVRSMAQSYRINVSKLFNADGMAIERVAQSMATHPLSNWPVHFNVDQYSLPEVTNQIRIWKKRDNIELVVVDHIGLIEYSEAKSANERIGMITRTLKKLAKELNIPIIAVSQLNRDNTKAGRLPILSDLRDSGAIEQDANVCIFIHKDDDGISEPKYALGALKNREGPAGWINQQIGFNGEHQIFFEMDGRYMEDE